MELRDISVSELPGILENIIRDEDEKKARLQKLRAELEEVEEDLRQIESLKSLLTRYWRTDEESEPDPKLAGLSLTAAARLILEENGNRPMTPGEIATVLLERGFKGDFSRMRSSLYMGMTRKPEEFRKTEDGWIALE